MSIANKAADDLKSFLNKLSPLFSVVKALEEIGSLSNAADEALFRKNDLYEKSDLALVELKKHEKLLLEAKEAVKSVYAQSDLSLEKAKASAQKILDKAGSDFADKQKVFSAEIQGLKQAVSILNADIRNLESDKSKAEGDLAAIRLELSVTKDRIMSLS